jgi:hypothetical protein
LSFICLHAIVGRDLEARFRDRVHIHYQLPTALASVCKGLAKETNNDDRTNRHEIRGAFVRHAAEVLRLNGIP